MGSSGGRSGKLVPRHLFVACILGLATPASAAAVGSTGLAPPSPVFAASPTGGPLPNPASADIVEALRPSDDVDVLATHPLKTNSPAHEQGRLGLDWPMSVRQPILEVTTSDECSLPAPPDASAPPLIAVSTSITALVAALTWLRRRRAARSAAAAAAAAAATIQAAARGRAVRMGLSALLAVCRLLGGFFDPRVFVRCPKTHQFATVRQAPFRAALCDYYSGDTVDVHAVLRYTRDLELAGVVRIQAVVRRWLVHRCTLRANTLDWLISQSPLPSLTRRDLVLQHVAGDASWIYMFRSVGGVVVADAMAAGPPRPPDPTSRSATSAKKRGARRAVAAATARSWRALRRAVRGRTRLSSVPTGDGQSAYFRRDHWHGRAAEQAALDAYERRAGGDSSDDSDSPHMPWYDYEQGYYCDSADDLGDEYSGFDLVALDDKALLDEYVRDRGDAWGGGAAA